MQAWEDHINRSRRPKAESLLTTPAIRARRQEVHSDRPPIRSIEVATVQILDEFSDPLRSECGPSGASSPRTLVQLPFVTSKISARNGKCFCPLEPPGQAEIATMQAMSAKNSTKSPFLAAEGK